MGNDEQFRRCCRILAIDPSAAFATNAQRVHGHEALSLQIAEATRRWDRDALLAVLAAKGVPAGPINNVAEAFDDAQVRHRGMQIDVDDGCGGMVPGVRLPIRFSRSPLATTMASPPLGGQ